MSNIITITFNNGAFAVEETRRFKFVTIRNTPDEDWKTASVHKIKDIPKGTELVGSYMQNYYGTYLTTIYNNWHYYIDPRNCDYIGVSNG